MSPDLKASLLKLCGPLAGILVLFLVLRLRGLAWRDQLAMRRPAWQKVALWMIIWIAWVLASDVVTDWLGMPPPEPWKPYPPLIIALRILAIGVLGPIAEELVFRGVIYSRLSKTRLGTWGAIVVIAAAWAAIHVQYELAVLAVIFLDGIVLGAARRDSGSVVVPILMHMFGNLYSIAESLSR